MSTTGTKRCERPYSFRDIGGCETATGRRLRTGISFRSAELQRASASDQLIARLRLEALLPALSERMRAIASTQAEHLAEVHEQIAARHGSLEQYLRQSCGVTSHSIELLRRQLLE